MGTLEAAAEEVAVLAGAVELSADVVTVVVAAGSVGAGGSVVAESPSSSEHDAAATRAANATREAKRRDRWRDCRV